jgi:hypothetical protein
MHPTTDSLQGKEYKMWDEWKDNHNCGDPGCKWCAPVKEAPEVCPPAPQPQMQMPMMMMSPQPMVQQMPMPMPMFGAPMPMGSA